MKQFFPRNVDALFGYFSTHLGKHCFSEHNSLAVGQQLTGEPLRTVAEAELKFISALKH